ncbi:hypothetical protein AB0I86_30455 [Streptomyces sp. NPDC049950]
MADHHHIARRHHHIARRRRRSGGGGREMSYVTADTVLFAERVGPHG